MRHNMVHFPDILEHEHKSKKNPYLKNNRNTSKLNKIKSRPTLRNNINHCRAEKPNVWKKLIITLQVD